MFSRFGYNVLYCLLVLTSLFSCAKKQELTKEAYLAEVTEKKEPLLMVKKFDDISFAVKYRPLEEMVLFDLKDSVLTQKSFEKVSEKYTDMHYFTFSIESAKEKEIIAHNNTDQNEYFMNLDYLVNSIQYDFYLLEGNDTLPCSICHYERNYGISSINNLNLAFEKKNKSKATANEITLVYDDKLFQVGKLKFRVDKETIENLPGLKYEKN